ncbi:hypothetical protein BJ875DRAFT_485648 [Amylocarpus encephaloides]|uniref:Uncharacterized protein n=1 Tax=Amylocarpus encephaloides TaxID=45428 RepID=A0A9P7YFX3_9HELO|nr:hypothetical protein BJ875DRAFT_485648 [Amylocarpus encephaloides]
MTRVTAGKTQFIPLWFGGEITSPVTLPASTTSLNPTGTVAWSSAKGYSSHIAGLFPIIQALIDNPTPPQASLAIKGLEDTIPIAAGIIGCLGGKLPDIGDGVGSSCGGGKNRRHILNERGIPILGGIFKTIIQGVSCISNAASKMSSTIKKGMNNLGTIPDVVKDVALQLKGLKPQIHALNDQGDGEGEPDKEDDDNKDEDEDEKSSTATSSSTSNQRSSTTSDTSSSRSSSSSSSRSTSKISSSSCSMTQTVTNCKVACKTSSTIGVHQKATTTEACSTSCYSSIGACSITGVTLTMAAVGTAKAQNLGCRPSNPLCQPDQLVAPSGNLQGCTGCQKDQSGFEYGASLGVTPNDKFRGRFLDPDYTSNYVDSYALTKRAMIDPYHYGGDLTSFLYGKLIKVEKGPSGGFVAHVHDKDD